MRKDPKTGRWKKMTSEDQQEYVENHNYNITNIFCFLFLIVPWIFIGWACLKQFDVSGTSLKIAQDAICGKDCVCSCSSKSSDSVTPPVNPKTGF